MDWQEWRALEPLVRAERTRRRLRESLERARVWERRAAERRALEVGRFDEIEASGLEDASYTLRLAGNLGHGCRRTPSRITGS